LEGWTSARKDISGKDFGKEGLHEVKEFSLEDFRKEGLLEGREYP
jgi:hypothetical protein